MSVAVVTGEAVTCSGAAYSGVIARPPSNREQRRRASQALTFQKLGNAEVEQFYLAMTAHSRFEGLRSGGTIRLALGMGHRLENRQEETDSASYIQALLVAVGSMCSPSTNSRTR